MDFSTKKSGVLFEKKPQNRTFHITWGSIQEWGCISADTLKTYVYANFSAPNKLSFWDSQCSVTTIRHYYCVFCLLWQSTWVIGMVLNYRIEGGCSNYSITHSCHPRVRDLRQRDTIGIKGKNTSWRKNVTGKLPMEMMQRDKASIYVSTVF